MKSTSFIFNLLVLCLTMLTDSSGQNDVYMRVQSENYQPVYLYIKPLQSKDRPELARQLQNYIISDLEKTRFFKIILTPDPDKILLNDSASTADFGGLQTISQAYFEGQLEWAQNSVALRGTLQGLPERYLIFTQKYTSPQASIRWMAHRIADDIVLQLTGQPGIASTQILFINKSKNLALMDTDGDNIRQITNNKSLNMSPCWSPAGDKVAFISYIKNNPELIIMNLENKETSKLSKQKATYSSPIWSPDGKKIAFTLIKDGNSDIYVMDNQGNNLKRLTDNSSIDTSPSWSPTGREIAFTSDRSGSPQIYIMDSNGQNVHRLTYETNYSDSPVWSPKGELVAFVAREKTGFHIYSIDVNGENLRCLTDGRGSNENPSWSPDGSKLTFASNRNGNWNIYIINSDGSGLSQISTTGANTSPKWSPRLSREVAKG
ncbi:Tol-Pal system beta propeller repeat protein TolB [bacterium]|nr:Tol-Pal system beta propeller repeat protein TolB [bacterium]MBU1064192.1 Tol-Pal system beta propeller repeat protein TolB [bacterium]MBU1633737.1 Tol-Pal system beta propeller repeat protein TolB [bacterium]MBU1874357.1 Tol-Pal system beta propeller repeat protein TolB [bacterium]